MMMLILKRILQDELDSSRLYGYRNRVKNIPARDLSQRGFVKFEMV